MSETASTPPDTLATPRFAFAKYALLRALIDEVAHDTDVDPTRSPLELRLGTQLAVAMSPDGKSVEVQVLVTVDPDPTIKPYHLEVRVAGLFMAQDMSRDELRTFGQTRAPIILWPFIREEIFRLTANGRYGHLLMDVVSLEPYLKSAQWEAEKKRPRPEHGSSTNDAVAERKPKKSRR